MDWTIPDRLRRWRWLRLLPLLAVTALLAACSSTTFLYNRLDFLVPWYVDDYVDLSNSQERSLDRLLEPFLDWHRRDELPRYAALLQRTDTLLDDTLTEADLQQLAREVEIAAERVQTRSLDWMLPVAEQLSEAQLEEFIANLREKQEELEEEYLERDREEYLDDTYDRLLDNCQDYLGRLDGDQRDILRRAADELQRSDIPWLAERELWIGRLEGLLQREPGWQTALREAVADRWSVTSDDYRSMYRHNLAVIQSGVMAVVNSRSERQDRHLRRKLRLLREDFLALSREGLEGEAEVSAAAP